MDVRIGVTHSAKELELELADDADPEGLVGSVEEALARGTGLLWLVDRRGRRTGVVVDKLAWIEVGSDSDMRHIGFGG